MAAPAELLTQIGHSLILWRQVSGVVTIILVPWFLDPWSFLVFWKVLPHNRSGSRSVLKSTVLQSSRRGHRGYAWGEATQLVEIDGSLVISHGLQRCLCPSTSKAQNVKRQLGASWFRCFHEYWSMQADRPFHDLFAKGFGFFCFLQSTRGLLVITRPNAEARWRQAGKGGNFVQIAKLLRFIMSPGVEPIGGGCERFKDVWQTPQTQGKTPCSKSVKSVSRVGWAWWLDLTIKSMMARLNMMAWRIVGPQEDPMS